MAIHQLERAQWQPYFDNLSRTISGQQVEINTASLAIGAQINQNWTPLNGLTYDPKSDIFEVATDNIDHLIPHPQNIFVDEMGTELRSIEVIDEDGNEQIVKLKPPLALSNG